MKVQSASIYFFLGSDDEKEDSDDEEDEVCNLRPARIPLMLVQGPDVRALHHRREVNKKRRGDDKKLQKQLNAAKKVTRCLGMFFWLQLITNSCTEKV